MRWEDDGRLKNKLNVGAAPPKNLIYAVERPGMVTRGGSSLDLNANPRVLTHKAASLGGSYVCGCLYCLGYGKVLDVYTDRLPMGVEYAYSPNCRARVKLGRPLVLGWGFGSRGVRPGS